MELTGRKVLVVGLGKTGEELCRFLLGRGALVRVSEIKSEEALGKKAAFWRERGAEIEAGGHRAASFIASDLIVLSPGVPPLAEAEAAAARGISVISEIELAFRYLKGRIIGVTGSNGKSTTTTLAHKMLCEGGHKAFLAGNIGTPLISFVDKSREDHLYVTEISSFQLEHARDFKVSVSAFLNISQNHLDWHKSFENYYRAKMKLVLSQDRGGTAILNRDDSLVWALREAGNPTTLAFSRRRTVSRGCFIRNGWLVIKDGQEMPFAKTSDVRLPGLHNIENVMAASLIARLFNVSGRKLRASIRSFRGLEHRLENVATVKGVLFVNDSKATTVDATLKALESFERKFILILGGKDKGGDFSLLRKPLEKKVRKVLLIGQAAEKIQSALKDVVPVETVSSFRELVRKGFHSASRGDVVLLAPACTSWDMFNNFEERGRTFKREVRNLAREIEGK